MTKRQDRDAIYVKRQFDTEIIVLCVRWYITYRLSYRDLVAMMAERGVKALAAFVLNAWEGAVLRAQIDKDRAPLQLFLKVTF